MPGNLDVIALQDLNGEAAVTSTRVTRAGDRARARSCANERVAEGVGLVVLDAPRIARAVIAPGQFVHLRIEPKAPTSSCDARSRSTAPRADRLEILYQVLGRGTRALAEAAPAPSHGPHRPARARVVRCPRASHTRSLVAGGLGAAPHGHARGGARRAAAWRSRSRTVRPRPIACSRATCSRRPRRRIEVATDDGSAGTAGS